MFAGNSAGLAERDIVVVWVTGNDVRVEFGPGPGLTAAQLRARFGAAETGFRVVLVGKDGGTKLTQATPLSTDTRSAPSTPCPCAATRSEVVLDERARSVIRVGTRACPDRRACRLEPKSALDRAAGAFRRPQNRRYLR